MLEEIEEVATAIEPAPVDSDSSYSEILEGQAEAPIKPEASVKTEEETTPSPEEPPQAQDQEIELEIGGKVFSMKQSEAVQLLENASKLAEREKTLTEKEKSLNRDYTQKSQQVAEFRKSFETTFGRVPEKEEIQALGKVWKSYFSNPQAKKAVDAIINGRFDVLSGGANPKPQEGENPYQPLFDQQAQEIADLKERLEQFAQTSEEREESEKLGNAQKSWQSWAAKKAEAGIKITEEIDRKMGPFVRALRESNPDLDTNQILDEAYEHATIKSIKKSVASQVFKSADDAKKGSIPRITPKSSGKADKEKTYSDIVLER